MMKITGTAFASWKEELEMPPRSSLYPLKPEGINTPFVESLISYVVRLAKAYYVSPKALVLQEIGPYLEKPIHPDASRIHSFWSENAHTLNGMNTSTSNWVQRLEDLTLRKDLRLLTMMTWSEVISRIGMFHTTKAWCPICYEEWRQSGQEVYDPLVWSFRSVVICIRHHRYLSLRCPYENCRKTPPLLTSRSLPGHCPKCGGWLGSSSTKNITDNLQETDIPDLHYWIAGAVGDLVASASDFLNPLKREALVERIRFSLEKVAHGNMRILASQLGVSERLIQAWLHGQQIPKLTTILQMCVRLDMSPMCFLTGKDPVIDGRSPSQFSLKGFQGVSARKRKAPTDPTNLRKALEAALLDDSRPGRSVTEIALQLGYSKTTVPYQYFPDLCHAISARRRIVVDSLRKQFEAVLGAGEDPPPSMRKVAARLGYSVQVVRKLLPDLCHAISEKYRIYRKNKHEETVRKLSEQVRIIVMDLHAQGKYPGKNSVEQLLEKPHAMLRKEVHKAWKDALQELGIMARTTNNP